MPIIPSALQIIGKVLGEEVKLNARDALGVWVTETINFKFTKASGILLIEIPMN